MNTRITCAISLGLVIAAAACTLLGTEPGGPDREVRVPSGWNLFNFQGGSYTYGIDHSTKHGGTSSAFIHGPNRAEASVVSFVQDLRAEKYLGKRIRWSGWVRTQNVASDIGGGTALWATVYDWQSTGVGYTSREVGSSEWHEISVVLDVPATGIGIRLGALLQGAGEVLMDDFKLDIVGTDVMTTGSVGPVSDAGPINLSLYYQRMTPDTYNLDFEVVPSTTTP